MKQVYVASLLAALMIGPAAMAQTLTPPAASAPVATPTEPASQTSDQNQRLSQQYEGMVSANSGFRAQRMDKECAGIDAPDLKQQCMASFGAEATSAPAKPAAKPASKPTTKAVTSKPAAKPASTPKS